MSDGDVYQCTAAVPAGEVYQCTAVMTDGEVYQWYMTDSVRCMPESVTIISLDCQRFQYEVLSLTANARAMGCCTKVSKMMKRWAAAAFLDVAPVAR